MGIGVSSITQRKSFTQEYMEHAHGATLGWWNHTTEDGLDKCDPNALEEDTRATLKAIYDLATLEFLPYDFTETFRTFKKNVTLIAEKYSSHMEFSDLLDNICDAEKRVLEIQNLPKDSLKGKANHYNDMMKLVARNMTNITMTCADKYSQDSYGFTALSYPVPLFAELERLDGLDPASLEYGLVQTKMIKNKNRINDALYTISKFASLYREVLKG